MQEDLCGQTLQLLSVLVESDVPKVSLRDFHAYCAAIRCARCRIRYPKPFLKWWKESANATFYMVASNYHL